MPHSPQTREITCAAIFPSAGDRRSRRYRQRRRPRRARPAATRRRALPTAMPAMPATSLMTRQVRARDECGSGSEVYPRGGRQWSVHFPSIESGYTDVLLVIRLDTAKYLNIENHSYDIVSTQEKNILHLC